MSQTLQRRLLEMRNTSQSSSQRSAGVIIFAMVLFMVCVSLSVQGQTIVGRIGGTVTDKAGAVIPNATITVTNPTTNLVRTATTDESGFYTLTNLPVGTYSVMVEQKGFK